MSVETSTPAEYRMKVLRSADETGMLTPPALQDWFAQQGLLMGLYMDGLIEKRGTGAMYRRTGPWFITAAGERERQRQEEKR